MREPSRTSGERGEEGQKRQRHENRSNRLCADHDAGSKREEEQWDATIGVRVVQPFQEKVDRDEIESRPDQVDIGKTRLREDDRQADPQCGRKDRCRPRH